MSREWESIATDCARTKDLVVYLFCALGFCLGKLFSLLQELFWFVGHSGGRGEGDERDSEGRSSESEHEAKRDGDASLTVGKH